MKKVAMLVVACALGLTASAQTRKSVPPVKGSEWWEKLEECKSSTTSVDYIPRTLSSRPVPAGLILAGLPREACVLMPLPEIGVKAAWVRQHAGAPYYFEHVGTILVPKFRKECLNEAVRLEYLETQAPVAPVETEQNVNMSVSGIPSKFDLNVNGGLAVHHDGKIDVNVHHDGAVEIRHTGLAMAQPPLEKEAGWAARHKKLLGFVAIGVGMGVGSGIYLVTRQHPGPVATTLPPGSGLPVVTTLPPH